MTKLNENIKNKYRGLTPQSENTLKKLCFFSQSAQNYYKPRENLESSSERNQLINLVLPANNFPKCVANFVGRELYLEGIEAAFSNENKKLVILSSMPGTGKTTLAIKFGYRFLNLIKETI